jgi:DNA-binding XRE family transcriptional regulator
MSESSPELQIRFADPVAFKNQVESLNSIHQLLLFRALKEILGRQGFALARSTWLKSLGGSLWEFRIGPSSKAVESKAGLLSDENVPQTKVLLRVFCSFQKNQKVIHGCYDKQRYGAGKRQNAAIRRARESLLTFKPGE